MLGGGPDGEDQVARIDGAELSAAIQSAMIAAFSSTRSFSGLFRKLPMAGAPCRISLAKSREAFGLSRDMRILARM